MGLYMILKTYTVILCCFMFLKKKQEDAEKKNDSKKTLRRAGTEGWETRPK